MKWMAIVPVAILLTLPIGVSAADTDVVVVVSAKSAVAKLSTDEISDIFLGRTEYFPNGSPAVPINLPEASPASVEFDTKALSKSPAQLHAYWAKMLFTGKGKPPKEVAGSSEVKAAVAGNPAAIGYIEKSAVDGSVKVVFGD